MINIASFWSGKIVKNLEQVLGFKLLGSPAS